MKFAAFVFGFLLVLYPFAGLSASQEGPVAAALDSLVQSVITVDIEDPIHNALIWVEAPENQWSGASGLADGLAEPMTDEHKFKIASIGKTFTATVILQLVEEQKLSLDLKLSDIFTLAEVNLDSLHIHNEVAYGHDITVEHLLGQTSGLRDYMEHPQFFADIVADPGFQWSPALILERYFSYNMHTQAANQPGEGFLYADPNYVLLGMVIEKITGSKLHIQYRERIFQPLNMENTYLEFYEEERGPRPMSHAFIGATDISEQVNTSFDWAGGGIVSTASELTHFYRALLDGHLFQKPETLELMLGAADRGWRLADIDYGYGIMKRVIAGHVFYGHGGAYDCDIYYSPKLRISVCTVLNQMNTHGRRDPFLFRAVELALLLKGE